jgi:hypothetical protein
MEPSSKNTELVTIVHKNCSVSNLLLRLES